MKNKVLLLLAVILTALSLTACGEDPELTQFRNSIEAFCTKVSQIDNSINSIDASSDRAVAQLLSYLDELDSEFQSFAELDFPEEFDYLEDWADLSGEYMSKAVSSYHQLYESSVYNENTAADAKNNYSSAYKCIQAIITYLHGDTLDDSDLKFGTSTE